MRVLIDSNVLLSALFYPESKPAKALIHAADNHELILTDHNIAELRRIASEKFSERHADIELFLNELTFELITAPEAPQKLINDPKDAPILNAAIIADIDVIISGDKHFLELNIERPKVMKAAEYLKYVDEDGE